MLLKSKIQLVRYDGAEAIYIDFDQKRIVSETGRVVLELTLMQEKIIRCLCLQSQNQNNGIVSNDMLFSFLYGDDINRNLQNVNRAMHTLF